MSHRSNPDPQLYRLAVWIVLGIFVFSGTALVTLSIYGVANASDAGWMRLSPIIETFKFALTASVSTLVGLVGGKMIQR